MIRSLTDLLDEWMPIVAGSEINDDPYDPVSQHARVLVAERGDETPIEWVHRDRRFGEKLATPDTSIADLIGEVDPIKVAEGRYLSDELTIHYGLVPRTNRGIFSINELPDLAERIQVGLLNVLEERDVQIRGYKIRLPLDLMLVGVGQPRGLHQPRPHHHAAQGPLRRADPHALPARRRARGRRSSSRRRAPLAADGLNVHVPELHDRDRRRDEPAGPPLAAHQPALGRVGAALDRQLRDARRQRHAPRAAPRRDRGRAARQRPRGARREHRGQGRVRDRRRRPRGAGARPHREGVGARDVPGPHPPGEAHRARPGVRRRAGRAHRRGHRVVGVRQGCSRDMPGPARHAQPTSTSARRPPASRRPSSSCSRACTCRSASTRTPSAAAPPTAAAAEPTLASRSL